MSYTTIARAANDGDLQQRCIAAAAAAGATDPQGIVLSNIWQIVSDATIADPYAYAVWNRVDRPGYYDDVVNDTVIAAVIDALVNPAP